MEELLGQYFDSPQTTIVDAVSDCQNDTSFEDGNPSRGRKRRSRSTEADGKQKPKRVKSKAPRHALKSRLDPLVGKMRPKIASTSSPVHSGGTDPEAEEARRDQRQKLHGEEQLRVVVDRL